MIRDLFLQHIYIHDLLVIYQLAAPLLQFLIKKRGRKHRGHIQGKGNRLTSQMWPEVAPVRTRIFTKPNIPLRFHVYHSLIDRISTFNPQTYILGHDIRMGIYGNLLAGTCIINLRPF